MTFDLTNRQTIFASLPKGGIGAEVGVAYCTFSKDIIRLAQPDLLYLIDCWEQQPYSVCGDDAANTSQESKDGQYYQALMFFVTDPKVRVVKAFSEKVAPLFPNEYLDFIYIDPNHLRAYQDCAAWWPKIKKGGYLIGDDYIDRGNCFTVKTDVNRFVAERGLKLIVAVDAETEYKNYIIPKE